MTIRDAVTAATGSEPACSPPEKLNLPGTNRKLMLMLLAPILIPLWLLFKLTQRASPSESIDIYPASEVVTRDFTSLLWVVVVAAIATVIWRVVANRAAGSPGSTSAAAPGSGCLHAFLIFIVASFVLGSLALLLTVFWDVREPGSPQPPPPADARLLGQSRKAGVSSAAISRVHTDGQKADVEARLDQDDELWMFIGDESLGWSMSRPRGGAIEATVRASNQIELGAGSLGKGLVFESENGAAYVAIDPVGPVPFGELIFRANDKIIKKDGVHTFADIHQADGALVPVSIRIRQNKSAPK